MRIFFIVIFLQLGNLQAQNVDSLKITYKSDGTSIKEIIDDLEKKYGVRFSYASASWLNNKKDVDFDNQNIDDVLEFLLADQNIEFKKTNNNILFRKSSAYEEVQDDQYKSSLHLKGKVRTDIGEIGSLAFATILVKNTTIGTYTNENGEFDLEIPKEYHNNEIQVGYIGFKDVLYRISELEAEFVILNLNEQVFFIEEVVIQNRKKPIRVIGSNNSISLSNTQIKNQAVGVMGSDINRSIQLLPGITAHDDDCSDIKMRGRNGDETLIILDGMPIYNTDHYFGIFSGVNPSYIDSVNVYKNNYPIQYGGRTSGLVEFLSENQIPNKPESEIGIDLLTVNAITKIPLSKNGAVQIAGRATPYGVNNNQFNVMNNEDDEIVEVINFGSRVEGSKSDPNFNFYDFNTKYSYRGDNNISVDFNFFRSYDKFTNNSRIELQDNRNDKVDLFINENREWATTASSVLWSQPILDATKIYTRAYYSNYNNTNEEEIEIYKRLNQSGSSSIPRNQETTKIGVGHDNSIEDFGIDTYAQYIRGAHILVIGGTITQQEIDYTFVENTEQKLAGDAAYLSLGTYGSYTYNPFDKLKINAGLRITYFGKLDDFFYSPRIQTRYDINKYIAIKASYSYEQQIIRQLYYEYRSEPLELWLAAGQNDIPVLSSRNFMVGTSLKLGFITLDIEAFQKLLDGTIEYSIIDPTNNSNNPNMSNDYMLFFGKGRVQGIDIIASYAHKKYDSYISYTLSRSQERYREINRNRFYASENDRRHQFKWVNTLATGAWTFDANGIFSSGRPYNNAENQGRNGDIRNAEPNDRLRRLPAYFRIDIGLSRKIKIGNQNLSLSLSVFNLLNTQNVKYIQSVSTELIANQLPVSTVIDNESTLLNRTVNVGANIKF